MAAKVQLVTEKTYQKMKEELDFLKNVKRREMAENVGIARSYGDLSENSEYDEAKNEQAKLEAQISELEEILSRTKIISESDIQTDTVSVGVAVTVDYLDTKRTVEYTIVSSRETDPFNNKISDLSPIGKSMIGAKVGDVVTVEVADRVFRMKIKGIKKVAHNG